MNAAPIYCANCGRPISPGSRFCDSCGAPVGQTPPPPPDLQAQPGPPPAPFQQPYYQAPPPPGQPAPPPAYGSPPGWNPAPAQAYPPPGFYRRMPYRRTGGGGGGWCTCFFVGCLVLAVVTCCVLIGGAYFLQRSGGLTPWLERWFGSQVNPVMTQVMDAIATQGFDPNQVIGPLSTQGIGGLPTFEALPTLDIFPILSATPQPLQTPGGSANETVFTDDFSSPDKGWTIETTNDYSVQYENEQLAVKAIHEGAAAFVHPPVQFKPTTLEFSVQVAPEYQSGTLGYFEVMCDYQDSNNYHTIAIDPDSNTYTIALVQDGTVNSLTSPEWKDLSADLPALRDKSVRIKVECTGGTMTLFVNDVYQDQATETTFTSGEMWIGLRLWDGSPYPDGFKILIDDLTIFRPVQ